MDKMTNKGKGTTQATTQWNNCSEKSETKECLLFTKRWRLSGLLFLAFMLLYLHSVNLSLAVVCMVDINSNTPSSSALEADSNTQVNSGVEDRKSNFKLVRHIKNASQDSYGDFHTYGNVTAIGYNEISYNQNRQNSTSLNGNFKSLQGNVGISKTTSADVTSNISKGTDDDNFGTIITVQTHESRCKRIRHQDAEATSAELNWTKTEISFLLSSYFYGHFFSQVPAGRLADRFGGKHMITVPMIITGICSLLTPICARSSLYLMFGLRIMIGLAGGAIVPVAVSMVSTWAPPVERVYMFAFSGCGFFVGTIVSFLTSGYLCVYGFDNGWPSIFYIHGCLTLLFVCVWCREAYSKPSHHPRISISELDYIQSAVVHKALKRSRSTPWCSMAVSKALWAVLLAQFAFNYSFTTILINLPLYMKEVLMFDIQENGLFSALPYVFNMISILLTAKMAGGLISHRILGPLNTRRIFSAVNLLGFAACLVFAGHVTCEIRYVAVFVLCLFCVFAGISYGGWFINHAEYAGQYAGTAFGITNAAGVIASILSSVVAGYLTPNGLQSEWQRVFYVAAGVDVIGAIVCVTCLSVTLQKWALTGHETPTMITYEIKVSDPLTTDNEKT